MSPAAQGNGHRNSVERDFLMFFGSVQIGCAFEHRWCEGRGTVGKSEAVQDLSRGFRRMNRGDDTHVPTAALALKNVDGKNAFHKLSPGIIASSWTDRFRGRLLNIAGNRLRRRSVTAAGSCHIRRRNDERAPNCGRSKDPVESDEMHSRGRHERGKFGDQILRFEDDRARAVSPWTL